MPFYSFEMILVGVILLSGMMAGGIKLWLKRKADKKERLKLQNIDEPKSHSSESETFPVDTREN